MTHTSTGWAIQVMAAAGMWACGGSGDGEDAGTQDATQDQVEDDTAADPPAEAHADVADVPADEVDVADAAHDETDGPGPGIWRPAPHTSWQWQLTDYPVDTSVDLQMYDVALFETPVLTIETLHAAGRVVICYSRISRMGC